MTQGSTLPVDLTRPKGRNPFTIAVMQPYFIPYAGYFRLFAASDLFVIYDCVQFPRRGWVHRNRIADQNGVSRWLTLPLEKAPQNVHICDLRFAPDAAALLASRLRPFRLSSSEHGVQQIIARLRHLKGNPVDYIENLLHEIVAYLGLSWNVIRSSALHVPSSLRGQSRILEIARRLGARRYVNAPGGRSLYDPVDFRDAGVELHFLPEYPGSAASVLSRLLEEDRGNLLQDILALSTGVQASGD
jgi:hypothetical protein